MKAKDIFSLMLRFFGLICVYQGLDKVPAAAAAVLPQFPHLSFGFLFAWFLSVAWPLAIGIYLVRGAPLVMRFAYGAEEAEPFPKPRFAAGAENPARQSRPQDAPPHRADAQ